MIVDLNSTPYKKFKVTGYSSSSPYFTISGNYNNGTIVYKSPENLGLNNYILTQEELQNADYLIFNFTNTNTRPCSVYGIITSVGGTSNYEMLSNKPSINGVTLIGDKTFEDLGLSTTKQYTEITNYETGEWFNTEGIFIGDEVPPTSIGTNTAYLPIDLSDINNLKFRVSGSMAEPQSAIWFTCSENPTEVQPSNLVTSISEGGLYYDNREIEIQKPEGANYLVFNFKDTDLYPPKVELITETIGGSEVKDLQANLDLNEGQPISLEAGFYNTGRYKVRHLTLFESEDWIGNYEIIYVANNYTIISDNYNIVLVDEGGVVNWRFDYHSGITNTVIDDDTMIPTSKAVYQAIQNIQPSGDLFYTSLEDNIALVDGTNTSLETGWYYLNNHYVLVNGEPLGINQNLLFFLYKDTTYNTTIFNFIGEQNFVECRVLALTSSYNWIIDKKSLNDYVKDSDIVTSISGSSTDSKVPSAKCVYDAIQNISPSGDSFYTELSSNVTFNQDGTTTPQLTSGYYYSKNHSLYFWDGTASVIDTVYNNSIFYYDSSDKTIALVIGDKTILKKYEYTYLYSSQLTKWIKDNDFNHQSFVNTYLLSHPSSVINSIGSTGNDYDVPDTNAIRTYVGNQISGKQNQVTASTTDLTAGTSPLATGEIYLVYEA